MTPDIATMPAGPEMDALIAERVFEQRPCLGYQYQMLGNVSGWVRSEPHADHNCYPEQCPVQYSQLIQPAWLVVEHMRESGYLVRVQEHPDGFPFFRDAEDPRSAIHQRALCLIERVKPLGNYHIEGRGYGDTAPLAICRAALSVLVTAR